jgi:uncharacterized protein (TIGR03435 family)
MTTSDGGRTTTSKCSTRAFGAIVLLVVSTCSSVFAQGPGSAETASAQTGHVAALAFDVVSVKRHQPGDREARMQSLPDGIRLLNVPLLDVIREAYGLTFDGQVLGAPDWMKTERFDIEEKVAPADVEAFKKLTLDQIRPMARPMLASRFKLEVHQDTRTMPVYALVPASGGLKMKEATPGDAYPNGIKGADGVGRPGVMAMRREMLPSGARVSELTGQGVTMERLVKSLSQPELGRMIVDKTGLAGTYDFKLSWTPETLSTDTSPDSANPTLFTAVQEQLGLKLQTEKDPVPVIVIEHVEMPSEN